MRIRIVLVSMMNPGGPIAIFPTEASRNQAFQFLGSLSAVADKRYGLVKILPEFFHMRLPPPWPHLEALQ